MTAGDDGPVSILDPNSFSGGHLPVSSHLVNPVGLVVTTLVLSSAVAVGSNLVDVRNRSMSLSQAVLNGLSKGAAASLILHAASRRTPLQVAMTTGVLVATGFLVDSAMKKNKRELRTNAGEVKG